MRRPIHLMKQHRFLREAVTNHEPLIEKYLRFETSRSGRGSLGSQKEEWSGVSSGSSASLKSASAARIARKRREVERTRSSTYGGGPIDKPKSPFLLLFLCPTEAVPSSDPERRRHRAWEGRSLGEV